MAWTLVQSAAVVDATSPITASFSSAPTEGNLLVAICANRTGTDTAGSISGWIQIDTINHKPTDGTFRMSATVWAKVAEASEGSTVTFPSTAAVDHYNFIAEFEPLGAPAINLSEFLSESGALDFSDNGGVNVDSVTTGSLSPSEKTYCKIGVGVVKNGGSQQHDPLSYDQGVTAAAVDDSGDNNGMTIGIGIDTDVESTSQALTMTLAGIDDTERGAMAFYVMVPDGFTQRHSGNSNTTAVEALSTDSQTPTADSLLLVFHGAQYDTNETGDPPPDPSGGGLTYSEIATAISTGWGGGGSFPVRGDMSRATVGGSPSGFQVTVGVDPAGNDAYQGAMCADVVGFDAVSPIEQSATNTENITESSSASGTVTFGATPATGNMVVVGFAVGTDGGGGIAAPTIGGQPMFGASQNTTFCQNGLWYRIIDGTETNATITSSDLGQFVGAYSAVAIEINADSGSTLVDGSLSETQDNQTMSVTAWAEATGTIAETQDDQTATITGQAEIVGTITETQDDQTMVASGFIGDIGTIDVTQDDQTSSASGVIGLTGSLDQTQGDQTMTATGTVDNGDTIGTIIVTQDDQTMVASGGASATGTATATQDDQTMVASGLADAVGAVSVAQEGDVMVAVGGTGMAVEKPDIRPRRSKLGSRVFPVRWPADKS